MANNKPHYNPYAGQPENTTGFPSPAEQYRHSPLDLNRLMLDHPSSTVVIRHKLDLYIVDRSRRKGNLYLIERNGERFISSLQRQVPGECRILGVVTWVIKTGRTPK